MTKMIRDVKQKSKEAEGAEDLDLVLDFALENTDKDTIPIEIMWAANKSGYRVVALKEKR